MNTKTKLISCLVSVILYSIILGLFGVFGLAVQTFLLSTIKIIIPFILILFGYFMCIFLPFRISKALRRNKEKEEEIQKELNLMKLAQEAKTKKQKILESLSNNDSTTL